MREARAADRLLSQLLWRGRAWSDPIWMVARWLFAVNWAYNAFPGKFEPGWYERDFARRVGYFAGGNPWPPAHDVLQHVVLAHTQVFAAMSAAGEAGAAVLLLFPATTRLGGAVAASVGLSYSASMDWVNFGYAVHNGSFALLGLLFLGLGGRLRPARDAWVRVSFVLLGVVGLGLAYPLAFRLEGVLPAAPWTAAALALLVHGVFDRGSDS